MGGRKRRHMESEVMRKFEVCVRGNNFLVRTGNSVIKNGFYAARFVEANDPSHAVEVAMGILRGDLEGKVLNSKADPPALNVEEVSEVYYFQEVMCVGDRGDLELPGTGFLWDTEIYEVPEEEDKSELAGLVERARKLDIHIHSMLIHFTNGLFPVAVLFMLIYLVSGNRSFDVAHFYVLVAACVSVPFSYATGILEWRRRYQGAMLPMFVTKVRFGMSVFVLGAASAIWHYLSPGVLTGGGVAALGYVILNLAVLVPVVYLGHLGATIVYEGPEREPVGGAAGAPDRKVGSGGLM